MCFFRKEFLPGLFIKRGVFIILKYLSIFTSSIFSRGPVCQGSDDVTQAGQGLVNGGTLLQAVSSGSRAVSSLTEIASMPTFIQWIPQVDFIYEIQKKKKLKWILLSQFYLYVYKNFKIIDI